jgi:hypothetical protein
MFQKVFVFLTVTLKKRLIKYDFPNTLYTLTNIGNPNDRNTKLPEKGFRSNFKIENNIILPLVLHTISSNLMHGVLLPNTCKPTTLARNGLDNKKICVLLYSGNRVVENTCKIKTKY